MSCDRKGEYLKTKIPKKINFQTNPIISKELNECKEDRNNPEKWFIKC